MGIYLVCEYYLFCTKFCNRIETILKSATLSISINGAQHGCFHCARGVRQGDPLSPILFCLAEDVLRRSITKLVEEGKLELMKGTRHVNILSHTLYADDIMIFYKGKISCINALIHTFTRYAQASGQIINTSNSTLYSRGINNSRLQHIVNLVGFNVGTLPFNYLGVPIFKGKPIARYLQPVADKVKAKLSA